ncbi:MAG: 50S ribosome-binding GTPase, partial [Solirubrobacterales bacterium]|nr:50S ribosome-binding GTPase [Solirubrobacterales bacterium]
MSDVETDSALKMQAITDGHGERGRRAALEAAVRAGQARSTEIRAVVGGALEGMSAAVAGVEVSELEGQSEARHVAEQFGAVFEDARKDLDSLFSRQQQRLASFNVVLFGRTGAGKSSIITALVRGNGQGISPGQTDYTDRVLDERWGDDLLRVKDTPGTQGRRAAELADIARREVEVADVVVLAFDDSNQLRGEFSEIAAYVKALGKPAIAMLNVKERAWGDPDRCVDRTHIRGVAKDVRDHAAHVREQLADLGLDGVPIVALNAQRAVYARGAAEYAGPDLPQCQAFRERWGRDLLLERSNFEVLDTLLEELATQDPAAMRTAMLATQATSVLDETADECEGLARRAAEVAQTLETSTRQLLELTGHPRHFPESPDQRDERIVLEIAELEQLRGGGFGIGALGDAEVNARRSVAQHLGTAEQATRARATAEVPKAMQQGRQLNPSEFRVKVVRQKEIQSALDAAAGQLGRYLERRVETIALQLSSAMSELQFGDAEVRGGAGRAADRVATGLNLAELALPLAALAFTPAGPLAALVVVASAVGSWLTGRLAKFVRRKSRRSRDEEITRAIAEAERTVREAFAELRPDAAAQLVAGCRAQLIDKLAALVAAARTLRLIEAGANQAAERLRQARSEIPSAPSQPQDAVRAAQTATADRLGYYDADLLLFERWMGAARSEERTPERQAKMPRARVPRSFGRRVEAGEVDGWVEQLLSDVPADSRTRAATRRLAAAKTTALPRVTVIGDYSTGKTSFLRRMHWELGVAAPRSLRVGAAPETDRIRRYRLAGMEFVDTPGHQSNRVGDSDLAREAILGSACLLYLVGPSLLTGSVDDIDLVLGSLESEARLRLVERTFWIINRIDGLPADPLEDPDTFVAVCAARQMELKAQLDERPALKSAGLTIDIRRILCVSSDPFGSLGARRSPTRAQLDTYSSWDGMGSMLTVLERLRPRLSRNAVPAGRAEHGVRILWEGGARASQLADEHRLRKAKLDGLAQACEAEAAAGEALR